MDKFEECEECVFGDGSKPQVCDQCEDGGYFFPEDLLGENMTGQYRTIPIKLKEAA